MELKRDAGNDPRKRAHMIRRLKKPLCMPANLYSCASRSAAHDGPEAEAYSSQYSR